MSEERKCAEGRAHRWCSISGLGWFNEHPVQVCDCGLLRVGVVVGGGQGSLDWTYYRIEPSAKYGEYDMQRHLRAFG